MDHIDLFSYICAALVFMDWLRYTRWLSHILEEQYHPRVSSPNALAYTFPSLRLI